MNTRNRLYYKRQKLDDERGKEVVTREIISVTSAIEKVRKEIRLCDEVSDNSRKMKEHIKDMNEREQKMVKEKEKKRKDRRNDR